MGILVLLLIGASMFSVDGIGEDLNVFQTPFVESDEITRISFSFYPEFNVLHSNGDYRGIFWSNPLTFSISVPVTSGFTLMAGNRERYNQAFDIYSEDSLLQVHFFGEGGIEDIYLLLSKTFGIGELSVSGSYLFGNSWEIWTYNMATHSLVDTFTYKYKGRIFSAGFRHSLFSVAYEGFGTVDAKQTEADNDTTFDLPARLSLGITPRIGPWQAEFAYERSFWDGDVVSPNRFRVGLRRDAYGFAYRFNPWYVEGVQEHGLDLDASLRLRGVGSASLGLYLRYRSREDLSEFQIVPSVHLVLYEIFARRRK